MIVFGHTAARVVRLRHDGCVRAEMVFCLESSYAAIQATVPIAVRRALLVIRIVLVWGLDEKARVSLDPLSLLLFIELPPSQLLNNSFLSFPLMFNLLKHSFKFRDETLNPETLVQFGLYFF